MSDPKWLALARDEIGVKEWPGTATNPEVGRYYFEATGQKQPDSVPWCAGFANAMLERAGIKGTRSLWAKSFLNWGQKLTRPIPGAIAVWTRGSGGHVAFVDEWPWVIGGNQSDAVTRARRSTAGLLGFRWPPGVPLPKALPKGLPMADKTAQEIVDGFRALYNSVDSIGISGAKPAIKKGIELCYYLAKLQLPVNHPAMKKALKAKVVKRTTKKARRTKKGA